ncbi:tRNA (adenosine(37)-N6)-dimethylallyltransferase MiaA [Curtobacterium ammoniigenes]|uniref:tRNA (adenosine(37)-N6)-dimethylallyltransferase MiaA n=1 Tax=Curtobacterium ammoniigenes TaxID=395387 RepID=UPI00278BBDD8|nr:tRNA (adenosine(37)-N6)-dimethylallyltransferase MiaA [Curtobacterium ammoniigenes]
MVGATGTGKTAVSLAIAERLAARGIIAEVVNADAMQLYRGMDIGTAKLPLAERRGVPHHQLDVLEPTDEASAAAYQSEARRDIEDIQRRDHVPLLVGGSGLYVSSVLFELRFPGTDPVLRAELEQALERRGVGALLAELAEIDPTAAATIDAQNPRRIVRALEIARTVGSATTRLPSEPVPWQPARIVHLVRDRGELVDALDRRAADMFDRGLVEEAATLQRRTGDLGRTARAAIGYAQAFDVLAGRLTGPEAVAAVAHSTRRYARRQVSWFRRYDAEQVDMTGVPPGGVAAVARRIVG